jgi:hypothetical protein
MHYIVENYRSKIEVLGISTNAAVAVSDETFEVLKKLNILVECDDYSKSIPQLKSKYNNFIAKLNAYGIQYHENKKIKFFKLFPPSKKLVNRNEQYLTWKFGKCVDAFNGQSLKNGHLYSCNYSRFAITAGIIYETDDDYFDLSCFDGTTESKKALVEFRLGYNNKGYIDFCKYCNGFPNSNKLKLSNGAEQAQGKLDWDINNPVYLKE